MGGFGSGRKGRREIVENCRSVDANNLAKWQFFKPGGRYALTKWSRGGHETGSCGIGTSIDEKRAICTFQYNDREVRVALSWYAPGYRGRRYLFVCPKCERRMRTLHFMGGEIACRGCHDLTYTSCNESHHFDTIYRSMAAGLNVHWRAVKMYMRLKQRAAKKGPKRPRGRPKKQRNEET